MARKKREPMPTIQEVEEIINKTMNFAMLKKGDFAAIDNSALSRFSVSRQGIQRALEQKDESTLRSFSQYFYYNSGEYRRLVDYFGNMLTGDFLLVPNAKESKELNKSIAEYFRNTNISELTSEIATVVVRDGIYFGFERNLNGVITFQTLPSNFCRTRYKVQGVYAVEFNYAFFDQYRGEEQKAVFQAFDKTFEQGYRNYLKDQQKYQWQLLPSEQARCHMLESPIPMLAPAFIDLLDLEEYKRLDKTRAIASVYKLIVQKVPLNNDMELTFEMEEMEQLHSNIRTLVTNANTDVVTTPFDVEFVDMREKNNVELDNTKKALETLYSGVGTPMTMFNAGSKASGTALNYSIATDEITMYPLLEQFQIWYQNKANDLAKDKAIVIFPKVTHFNKSSVNAMYNSASAQGYPTKMLAMTVLGYTQFEIEALTNFENNILDLPNTMIPTKSAHTTSTNSGGRPEKEEKDLSEEGVKTKENNKNDR